MKPLVPALLFLALAAPRPAAQAFDNLDFEAASGELPTGLRGWERAWASTGVTCGLAEDDEGRTLCIASTSADGVGFVKQVAAVPASGAGLLRVAGRIRTAGVEGRGAGWTVTVLDADGAYLFNQDLGYAHYGWARGDRAWRTYELAAVVPAGAARVELGALLYGRGTAWFDDLFVEQVPVAGRRPSPLAERYLGRVVEVVGANSIQRGDVDLDALAATALAIAGPAEREADCHLAVRYLLRALGDQHSFLLRPDEVTAWRGEDEESGATLELPEHRLVEGCGLVTVPGMFSTAPELEAAYAERLQTGLRELDAAGVAGWIVDLRADTGGNMSPMIAGLGPLLDAGPLGWLLHESGREEPWSYRGGAAYSGDEPGARVADPVRLRASGLPIAVLIGPRTGSSGEAAALSFVGNTNTRLFGRPTWGLSTGNGEFELPDGALLFLTSMVMADRTKRPYGGAIEPDVATDEPLRRALAWIRGEEPLDSR